MTWPQRSSTPSNGRWTSARSSLRGIRMLSRGPSMRGYRSFLLVIALVLCTALPLVAQPFPPPFQPPLMAENLWPQLMKGNDLFIHGAIPYTELENVRKASAAGQHPPVTILACSDSRVPPELVFARGLDA